LHPLAVAGQNFIGSPLKIPESGLLFIYFADIRRGAAGRTDCRSRMAGLQGFFAFA
jgi:hypothetical protein